MLQDQQQQEQLPQLPEGILQQVLSYVPLQHRLGSCSLASRAMHAAAVAATDEIYLAGLNSQQKASELCQWLERYGSQALRHLEVQARMAMWRQPMLGVELNSGLQQLQSLTLSQFALPAALDSCAHSKLTSLCLEHCLVCPCSDVFAWVARQLVHLTDLQNLQLHCLYERNDPPKPGVLAFEEALGQLQQLTCLGLTSNDTMGAAVATASRLSQLQELQLDYVGTSEKPVQMQWLPSSLTYVRLANCTVSCAADGSGSSSSSSVGWKLPVLKQLELTGGVGGFEPALLKQMPQLRVFSYTPTEGLDALFDEGPQANLEQQLVQVLPQLQSLQQLQLEYLAHWPSPSNCASLTASSKLTALLLMECRLPAGAVQHMFAAGQQLQQLQRLEVIASEGTQENVDHWACNDLQTSLEHNVSVLQPGSLKLGPGDLAKLVSCCPRFCELKTIWCDLPGPARGEAAGEAAPLLQLTALTALQVAGRYWNDAVVESVLANMTGEVNSSWCWLQVCCLQLHLAVAGGRMFSYVVSAARFNPLFLWHVPSARFGKG
jgi:hypothetical protein